MSVKETFLAFAQFGSREPVKELDGRSFVKLCRDAGLMGKNLTVTDIDLIFAKVKSGPNAKRITFSEFQNAMQYIADKKACAVVDVAQKILEATPATNNTTQALYNKFHDNKRYYTGVHANGGPSVVDKVRAGGLAGLLDRSPADVRGIKLSHVHA